MIQNDANSFLRQLESKESKQNQLNSVLASFTIDFSHLISASTEDWGIRRLLCTGDVA